MRSFNQTKKLAVAFVLTLLPASVLNAQVFDAGPLQKQIYDTIEKVTPAVVWIAGRGTVSSGVIVTPEGHVLSAGHAIIPGQRYSVRLPDGRNLSARGMGSSGRLDCALLKINDPEDLPFVEMGDSSGLVENHPCLSLSYPAGQRLRAQPVVRFGRVIRKSGRQRMIQTNAVMEPGDSGGPLFDLNGKVIGIHSRIGRRFDHNYDVPIDTFKKSWTQLNHAEAFSTWNDVRLPVLGFQGESRDQEDGVKVVSVVADGIAKQHGLLVDDIVTEIEGAKVTSIRNIRSRLEAAQESGAESITMTVIRDDESKDLVMPFKTRKLEPVSLPDYRSADVPRIQPIRSLARWAENFSELESKLDDHSVVVKSRIGGESQQIVATFIKGGNELVTKNSMVGDEPVALMGREQVKLEVIARDTSNDLILLRTPSPHERGIDMSFDEIDAPQVGRLLLSPDPRGQGIMSVLGSPEFASRKVMGGGFLGVIPIDTDRPGAYLDHVEEDGAAKSAGLQVGDIIVQMNETKIDTQLELRRFLSRLDPNNRVIAKVLRNGREIEKEIFLGSRQNDTNHAADMMEKSGRRDGFTKVFSHDANLEPEDCGGPLFDLDGNFVGLNIARNSRVRSFAIPRRIIREFVQNN